jgi:ABC-type multidrug transport system fused ATPase/permease subunit
MPTIPLLFASSSLSVEQYLTLRLSPFMLGVVCILCPVILAYLGLLLTRKLIPNRFLSQHHEVTSAIFGTLGTVYGIFLAFVVATTWQNYSATGTNLVQEARCLGDLYANVKASSPEYADEIRQIIRDYRDAVVQQEWKSLARGEANPHATELLGQLSDAMASHKVSDSSEWAFFLESVRNLNRMKELRSSRIDDSSSGLTRKPSWPCFLPGSSASRSTRLSTSTSPFPGWWPSRRIRSTNWILVRKKNRVHRRATTADSGKFLIEGKPVVKTQIRASAQGREGGRFRPPC